MLFIVIKLVLWSPAAQTNKMCQGFRDRKYVSQHDQFFFLFSHNQLASFFGSFQPLNSQLSSSEDVFSSVVLETEAL